MIFWIDDYAEWKENCEERGLEIVVKAAPDTDEAINEYGTVLGEYDFQDERGGWIDTEPPEYTD
jgi:hypothetical protein